MAEASEPIGEPAGLRLSVDGPGAEAADLFERALDAQRRGDNGTAVALYRELLESDPSNVEALNNLGAVSRATGDLRAARDAYRRALALDPTYAAAWSNLGVVLGALNDRDQARAAFQEALRLDEGNLGAKVNLAIQYHASGLHPDARRLLEEALRADPALAEAHYQLARVLEDQGERDAAIRHYTLFLDTSAGRFGTLEARVRQHLRTLIGGGP